AAYPSHIADLGRGVRVPPGCQLPHPGEQLLGKGAVPDSGRLTADARVEMKRLLDNLHQFVQARVAHALLLGRRQRKHPLEAKDIPRIAEGAAVNSATEQVFNLRQELSRLAQPAVLDLAVSGAAATEDLTEKAHRWRRNPAGLSTAGFGIAHLGEE